MPEYERKVATVGLLMLAFGVLCMRRTRGKDLKMLGFTLLSSKALMFVAGAGALLVAIALMMSEPGES